MSESAALTPEQERKIAAYDAARATVKIEGNTRASYVLRAEIAEAEVERLREAISTVSASTDDEWAREVLHSALAEAKSDA